MNEHAVVICGGGPPVAARVLQNTIAQNVLLRASPGIDALRAMLAEFLATDEPRRRLAGMLSAMDVHYDLGPGHPLRGRRMPDLDLTTVDGTAAANSPSGAEAALGAGRHEGGGVDHLATGGWRWKWKSEKRPLAPSRTWDKRKQE